MQNIVTMYYGSNTGCTYVSYLRLQISVEKKISVTKLWDGIGKAKKAIGKWRIDYRNTSSYVYTLRLIGQISYSWRMWFSDSPTKVQRHFLHESILLLSYVYNMHQDTKSARLIAVCKRTFKARLHGRFFSFWRMRLSGWCSGSITGLVIQRSRVRFPAGGPWSCIFRSWSRFGSYNVYHIDTQISNT